MNVEDLAGALMVVKDEFDLDSVSGSRRDDDHILTLCWDGDLLSIQRDDGEVVLLNPQELFG